MPRVTLEVCVDTEDSAEAAAAGGADRLELCSQLGTGGLTPGHRLFHRVRVSLKWPVAVMIRQKFDTFVLDHSGVRALGRDIAQFLPLAPAAFVFGALTADNRIDAAAMRTLVAACGPVPAVFHRAFDQIEDKPAALEQLVRLGFARVLTAGGPGGVLANLPAVKALVKQAGKRIEVMPGGGVTADTAAGVVQFTKCKHLHGTFSEPYGRGRRTSRAAVAAARAAVG